MAVRFNPAPGWPAPPHDGYLPEPGWQPVDLPPAPKNWSYLVDDDPRAPSPVQSGPVIQSFGGTWNDVVAFGQLGGGYIYYNGVVLVIRRRGFLDRVTIGKGEKRIPARSISSIQLKPAGSIMSGFIQIGLSGANEVRSKFGRQSFDAANDENSVMFTKQEQPQFERLRDRIESDLAQAAQPAASVPPSSPTPPEPDLIDQIRRLGELRDAGILTLEEFETKKKDLLSRL